MSIRVLDPDGRVLRPISPSNAKSKVGRSLANWVCAEGFKPNMKRGTIIMKKYTKILPGERVQTQIFNADGQLLGWIWPEVADRVLTRGWCNLVGSRSSFFGPRAVIIPFIMAQDAMKELQHIEARRTTEAVIERDYLRHKIMSVISKATTWNDVEEKVNNVIQQHLGEFEKETVLSDLRFFRRKVVALEIALAPDMSTVRHELLRKLTN